MTLILERYFKDLERGQPWRWRGQVLESVGQTIESAGPLASVGECCEIQDQSGRMHLAEVIGFRGSNVLSMPVESTEGIRYGNCVEALGTTPEIEVGPALMGRVLNAFIPGGGAWQDYSLRNEFHRRSGLYVKSQLQYEHISHYPLLFNGRQQNVTAIVELGFTPTSKKRE